MHTPSRSAAFLALSLAACSGGADSADHEIPVAPELAGKAFYEADLDGL
jgi:hypothetical protein